MRLLIAAAFAALLIACGCGGPSEDSIAYSEGAPPGSGAPRDYAEYGGAAEADFAGKPVDGFLAAGFTGNDGARWGERNKDLEGKPPGGPDFPAEGGGGAEPPKRSKRMIVYTAKFLLNVYDREAAADEVVELAEEAGGYVFSQTNDTVIVRVPAESFRKITRALPDIGQVITKDIKASDVTEKYMNLKLRIAAKQKYLESLQNLLERAEDTEIMLEIQREIGNVVEQIETLQGTLRYLADQVAFSTIAVSFSMATAQVSRRFRLPFRWIDRLGIEHLIIPGGGVR